MTAVLEANGLGKRYRRLWALSDCTLDVPAGRVVGLVGPNGAGKSTLLKPGCRHAHADLGHDRGARLPPGRRLKRLGLDPAQAAGKLSGGQRAQLALTLGVAKRPELLILDEPIASLDPLARREFLQDLMEAVADQELSVVLSSHLVSDVERACDYLIVLVDSRVQVAGDIETLLSTHHRLTGPRREPKTLPADQHVISASHTDRQSTAVTAAVVVLAITGPRLADLSRVDPNVFDRLTRTDQNLFFAGIIVLGVAPAVIGAFWGAPLVARELEAGTHRLVWNQAVTRTRWLATKLAMTTVAATAAVGVLTLAVSWWSEPIDGAMSSTRGNLPAPAMALTLAVFAFVQIAMPLWVRPHLAAPVQENVTITRARLDGISSNGPGTPLTLSLNTGGHGDWLLSQETLDGTGRVAALPAWFADCLPGPPSSSPSPSPAPVQVRSLETCFAQLADEGYRQRVVYQPASRFWPLQWAETALFLAFSGLLTWFCFWWTRHRLS